MCKPYPSAQLCAREGGRDIWLGLGWWQKAVTVVTQTNCTCNVSLLFTSCPPPRSCVSGWPRCFRMEQHNLPALAWGPGSTFWVLTLTKVNLCQNFPDKIYYKGLIQSAFQLIADVQLPVTGHWLQAANSPLNRHLSAPCPCPQPWSLPASDDCLPLMEWETEVQQGQPCADIAWLCWICAFQSQVGNSDSFHIPLSFCWQLLLLTLSLEKLFHLIKDSKFWRDCWTQG